jgi:hypothetical protein
MSELPAEQTWLVLVELLTDLRKKEIEIPKKITKNIQMAKTTINFYKVDPTDPQRQVEVKRINEFLTSIQDSLMTLAEQLGSEYTDTLSRETRSSLMNPGTMWTPSITILIPSVMDRSITASTPTLTVST